MELILFYNGPYPQGMAMTKRLHCYAKALKEDGVGVQVFIPGKDKQLDKGIYQGISWGSVSNPWLGKSYIIRQLGHLLWAFIYARHCYQWSKKGAMIFLCGFGWWTNLLAIMAIHLAGSKALLEVNENPYSPEGGRLDPVWLRRWRRRMVLFLVYSHVDGFVVISEKLAELVARYKKKSAQIIKIPILVDDHEDSEDAETVLKTNGSPYILHAGALSETKDGVLAVFKAFVKVNQSQALDFYLTSNSMQPSLANQVNQLIKQYKLEHRVHFTGFLETRELTKLRKNSALAIINKPLNWQNKYNFPTKLAEYLMDEVPLIVSEGGEMSHFLENKKNALIVSANNVDQIAASMLQILDDPQQAARIGEAGKALAKRVFYYRNYRATLGEFYRCLANKN